MWSYSYSPVSTTASGSSFIRSPPTISPATASAVFGLFSSLLLQPTRKINPSNSLWLPLFNGCQRRGNWRKDRITTVDLTIWAARISVLVAQIKISTGGTSSYSLRAFDSFWEWNFGGGFFLHSPLAYVEDSQFQCNVLSLYSFVLVDVGFPYQDGRGRPA